MKLFNYEKIWIMSHGNPEKLLQFFKKESTGKDFILNPGALVDAFWLTPQQRAEYLGICSLRSYNDYLTYNEVDLSLDLIPNWVPMKVIETHPLITKTNTKIVLIKEHINGD